MYAEILRALCGVLGALWDVCGRRALLGAPLSRGPCEVSADPAELPTGDAKKAVRREPDSGIRLMAASEIEQDDQRREQQGEYYDHAPTP